MYGYDPLAPNLSKIAGIPKVERPNIKAAIEKAISPWPGYAEIRLSDISPAVFNRLRHAKTITELKNMYVKSLRARHRIGNVNFHGWDDRWRIGFLDRNYGAMEDISGRALKNLGLDITHLKRLAHR